MARPLFSLGRLRDGRESHGLSSLGAAGDALEPEETDEENEAASLEGPVSAAPSSAKS